MFCQEILTHEKLLLAKKFGLITFYQKVSEIIHQRDTLYLEAEAGIDKAPSLLAQGRDETLSTTQG